MPASFNLGCTPLAFQYSITFAYSHVPVIGRAYLIRFDVSNTIAFKPITECLFSRRFYKPSPQMTAQHLFIHLSNQPFLFPIFIPFNLVIRYKKKPIFQNTKQWSYSHYAICDMYDITLTSLFEMYCTKQNTAQYNVGRLTKTPARLYVTILTRCRQVCVYVHVFPKLFVFTVFARFHTQ